MSRVSSFSGGNPVNSIFVKCSYRPEKDLVRYWPSKAGPEDPTVFEWKPPEFLARFARLIPPARRHLVRYHGVLAPRSPLRPAVTRAAREEVSYEALVAGVPMAGLRAIAAAAERVLRKAAAAAARSWVACLRPASSLLDRDVPFLIVQGCGTARF